MKNVYEVIVGNVGRVLKTNNRRKAISTFNEYVKYSQEPYGRESGENVVLFVNNDILKEYFAE